MHVSTKMMEDRRIVIKEITSFSTYEMFRTIFPITKLTQANIELIESYCQLILKKQLQSDFLKEEKEPFTNELSLLQTNLEQGLSHAFGRNMAFWEKYYARRSKMGNSMNVESIQHIDDINEIGKLSRIKYYHHYIPMDTLYYLGQTRSDAYELIQQSIQWYLESQLFKMLGRHDQSQSALIKALQIIGPLDIKAYRNYLSKLL